MKFTSEIKIGITGVVTAAVIIWGINYLKGRNILDSTYTIVAKYERVDGLEPSANVMLKGFKIGTVEEVIFETEAEVPFTVVMEIEKSYPVRTTSVAEITSANLLGSKEINIIPAAGGDYLENGDMISGGLSGDRLSSLMEEVTSMIARIDAAVVKLDSVGAAVNRILNDPNVERMVANMEEVSGSVRKQLSPKGDITATLSGLREISTHLGAQNVSIATSIRNLEKISTQVSNSALDSLINNLNDVAGNLRFMTSEMQQGTSSLGKLIYDDSLYQQIGKLITNLDSLVTDVNENPKKYVSFSLIGK
ncbi:MAG: MlaD family protein [Bacteroidales bacterium]|nr:MlaD family protein [Bacteroidales bacterium]MDT8431700.1 MlaD family protein [Bacteroidales bacterium]